MIISREAVERYRHALEVEGKAAADYAATQLKDFLETEPTTEDLIDFLDEIMGDVTDAYGEMGAATAAEFFDAVMAVEDQELGAEVFSGIDADYIHGMCERYATDPEIIDRVRDISQFIVKRAALECTIANCDKRNIKYARVPSGRETCGFCLMLASRGWVYKTEKTAEGTNTMHRGCDCIIVPGIPGVTKIRGYDPDALYERYLECVETAGILYYYGDPERKRVVKEIERRGTNWFLNGTPERVRGSVPEELMDVSELLSGSGFIQEWGDGTTLKISDGVKTIRVDGHKERSGRIMRLANVVRYGDWQPSTGQAIAIVDARGMDNATALQSSYESLEGKGYTQVLVIMDGEMKRVFF